MAKQVKIKLNVDSKTGQASIKRTSKEIKNMEKQSVKSGKTMSTTFKAVGVAVAAVGAATLALSKSLINYGDELDKMSLRLGVSTDALDKFKTLAQLSGNELVTVSTSIAIMSRNLDMAKKGTGEASDKFKELGLNVKSFASLAPEEAFIKLSESIMALQDPMERQAASQILLGRGGKNLLSMMGNLRGSFDGMSSVMDDRVTKSFATFNDNIILIKKTFTDAFIPILTDVVEKINEWIKANENLIGTKIKDYVENTATAVDVLATSLHYLLPILGAILTYKIFAYFGLMGASAIGAAKNIKLAAGTMDLFPKAGPAFVGTIGAMKTAVHGLNAATKAGLIGLAIFAAFYIGKIIYDLMNAEKGVRNLTKEFNNLNKELVEFEKLSKNENSFWVLMKHGFPSEASIKARIKLLKEELKLVSLNLRESGKGKGDLEEDEPAWVIAKTATGASKKRLALLKEFEELHKQSTMKTYAYSLMKIDEDLEKYRAAGFSKEKIDEIYRAKKKVLDESQDKTSLEEAAEEEAAMYQRQFDVIRQSYNDMQAGMESKRIAERELFKNHLESITANIKEQEKEREGLMMAFYNRQKAATEEANNILNAVGKSAHQLEIEDVKSKYSELYSLATLSKDQIVALKRQEAKEIKKIDGKSVKEAAENVTKRVQSIGNMFSGLCGLLGEFNVAMSQMNEAGAKQSKEDFERQKKFQIAQAVMSTAAAVANALGQWPFSPANYINAGLVSTLGHVQVATINKQEYAYAKGGVFTNQIVSKPTQFNNSEMGEKGPEGILPLDKMADGSLGVKSSGSGETIINNYYQVTAMDSESFTNFMRKHPNAMTTVFSEQVQRGNQGLNKSIKQAARS